MADSNVKMHQEITSAEISRKLMTESALNINNVKENLKAVRLSEVLLAMKK